ncbi:MAG: bifunctional riboflavin kinase/FAD synthetase [Clostridia bacterium]|nr:bifunctional riboflavin kinase/FAD synthetase [Clostridia bacterium]
MRSFKTNTYVSDIPTVVALGCFDGVHLGHKAVISEAVRIAQSLSVKSAVWTFEESPRNFFSPGISPSITGYEEKRRLMRSLGVDIFVCIPFDSETGETSPENFFEDVLVNKLKAVHVVCGFNYSFGKGGVGNTELLAKLCRERGIGFSSLSAVEIDNEAVSSSRIRSALEAGDVEGAKKFLGHRFAIDTIVISGQKLARRLGFPTVNQVFEPRILVPRRGVYVTRVSFDSKKFYGITNVGMRPTVKSDILCAETHIFGFDGNLYGKNVRVEFLHFLRPEIEFESVDALAEQVRADIESAKQYLSSKAKS